MEKKLVESLDSIIFNISSPIEQSRHTGKGKLWAMLNHARPLTNRQQRLLDLLPGYDSRVTLRKSGVSMDDLAALTAKTGDEFAMFTRGPERLVVRGNWCRVNISSADAAGLNARGYRWSGHTHTGSVCPSEGDKVVLKEFNRMRSVIYDAMGNSDTFTPF